MQKSWDNEQNKNSKPSFFAHHLLTLSGIKKNIKISFILKGHMRAQCAGHRWYTLLVTISSRGSDRCRHSTLITLPINLCQDFDQSTKNKNDYGRISSGNKSPSVAKLSSAFPYLFYFPVVVSMLTTSSSSTSITSSRKKQSYFDQSEADNFVTPQAGDIDRRKRLVAMFMAYIAR